jgi:hypothetical protein
LPRLSREFQLVAACCVWPPSPERDAVILSLAAEQIAWPQVAAIARRQRVAGLVHSGLARAGAKLPTEIARSLAERALEIAQRGLAHAVESSRLQGALDAAGIGNLVLKGAAVEMLAYRELGRKDAWDIDLLVSPADVQAALSALRGAGYELVEPANLTSAQFSTFVGLARECELFNRQKAMHVELHWGLADGPVLLAGMSVASPAQWVAVTETIQLRTLAPEELFSYLCVHGAMHAWSRLKWLADLAALISHEAPVAIEALYWRSRGLGAGVCSAQALLLCEQLLSTPLDPGFTAHLRGVRGAPRLAALALQMMAGGGDRELDDRPFSAARILRSQLALGGTWRAALAQLRYRMVSVYDRVHTPLPKGLRFLYPVLRAPLWFWRRLAKAKI